MNEGETGTQTVFELDGVYQGEYVWQCAGLEPLAFRCLGWFCAGVLYEGDAAGKEWVFRADVGGDRPADRLKPFDMATVQRKE